MLVAFLPLRLPASWLTAMVGVLLLIALPRPAHAHLFLEPDVGFEAGSSTQDFQWTNAPETKSSFNQNGATVGGILGYRQDMVYLGGQYERGLGGHITDITALAGANFAIRFRFWIGWIVSAKDDVSSGSGFKVGLGAALTRIFRLNAEYASRSYNKYTAADVSALTYSGTHKTFKITLSIPFQL